MSIITHFATAINRDKMDTESAWYAARRCFQHLGLVDCVIYWLDEARKVLVPFADTDLPAAVNRSVAGLDEVPVGRGIAGKVAATGSPELINDLRPDHRSGDRPTHRQSALAIPIFGANGLVGVFESEHPERGYFRDWHLQLLSVLAGMYGGRLQRQAQERSRYTSHHPKFQELTQLLEKEELFRDPQLTLGGLADQLNIGTTLLSKLVNEAGGQKFNDFINRYRVEAALCHLRDPDFGHYDTLSIGLEAGFNSKSTFYSAFRKVTGITPAKVQRYAQCA